MIDAAKATVSIRFVEEEGPVKALVSFKQDGIRFSGFRLKDGPYGLWLEPPMIGTGFKRMKAYFDEDADRFKALQAKVVEEYEHRHNPSTREICIDNIDFPEPGMTSA